METTTVDVTTASSSSSSLPTFNCVAVAGRVVTTSTAKKKINSGFTVIECGTLSRDGKSRQYFGFSEFFGQEVEVFTAASDPHKELLYRATLLGKSLGFENNKIGMYLYRKRGDIEGVFCAQSYLFKPDGVVGLKSKSYFLTEDACRTIKKRFLAQSRSKLSSFTLSDNAFVWSSSWDRVGNGLDSDEKSSASVISSGLSCYEAQAPSPGVVSYTGDEWSGSSRTLGPMSGFAGTEGSMVPPFYFNHHQMSPQFLPWHPKPQLQGQFVQYYTPQGNHFLLAGTTPNQLEPHDFWHNT